MRSQPDATYFALGLSIFLLTIVVLLNLIGPTAAPISLDQFKKIQEVGLIDYLVISPHGYEWQLHRSVRIQGASGDELAVRVKFDESIDAVVGKWRASGGEIREEHGDHWWAGSAFIALLIGVGLWHVWYQIRLDLKGEGSPRRRLRDLEQDRQQGKIDEEEFRVKAERLWAEL